MEERTRVLGGMGEVEIALLGILGFGRGLIFLFLVGLLAVFGWFIM
jgi:hypothetical protein